MKSKKPRETDQERWARTKADPVLLAAELARRRAIYARNRAAELARGRAFREANPDYMREYARTHPRKNRVALASAAGGATQTPSNEPSAT